MRIARQRRRVRWALYAMLVPGVVITLTYSYGPLMGLVIAFQKFKLTKGLFGSEWVGLANFTQIFKMSDFSRALINTLIIAVSKILLGLSVPIIVSVMLNEVRSSTYKRSVQTFIYLPFFISWVIVSGIMQDILTTSQTAPGLINGVLMQLGFDPVFFLGDPTVFRYVLIFTEVWKSFGFGTIIYLAAITGIDPSLYEAASIDGANRYHRMWFITVPGIIPIIVLNGTLSLGNVLNAGFDQIVNMYSPVVYKSGDIIDTLVYRVGIIGDRNSTPRYEVATAIGFFKSVVSFVLVSTSYYTAHKFADYKIF
jgi:putative aldouronate transport system permease protein